ncbi:O-methyltransferase [uncultured Tyzzerella sp.]|uniref:O-methyltransferase n=1 Tax=uncultured Tyzzerella sp. TaxID=2321398 RepID=UPI002943426A|nr:O-methyltransferase [uncultured Tyzzerella sp.]
MALIDENLDIYLNNLMPKVDGALGELQQKSYSEGVPIIPNDVVRLISVLLSIKKPKKILEIGCAVGFSSSFMSGFLQEGGKVTTIERYPVMIEKAKANIKALGLEDKINLIEGDANEVLKTLDDEYDVIFMDAGKGQYINILPDVYRLLKIGGIIIADDILQNGDVAKQKEEIVKRQRTIHYRLNDFLWEITHNKGLNTSILTIGDGVAICYKTKNIEGLIINEQKES